MYVYRLSTAKWARIIDGEGARLAGGRWNSLGQPLLYTSRNAATAFTEILVHTDPDLLPDDYQLVRIFVPDDAPHQVVTLADFPAGWSPDRPEPWFAMTGDAFIAGVTALYLEVPSVTVTTETNVLINPKHPRFEEVYVAEISTFPVDPRFRR